MNLTQSTLSRRASAPLGLLLCLSMSVSSAHSKIDKSKVYQLKQKSGEIGSLTIVVSDSGLKATNDGRGYFIVSHPPKWDVTIARPKDKIYASMPVEQWCKSSTLLFMIAAGAWDGDWSKRPATACTWCAMPAHKYECKYASQRTHRDLLIDANVVPDVGYKLKTTLVMLDLNLPEPAEKILGRLDGVPNANGVPAMFENLFLDGHSDRRLNTLECTKVSVPGDLFTCPKDYRSVDYRKLILNDSERNDFDSLAKDMDVGRGFGKPKSQK